ncbi:MAG: leucine-rich repeat protein [Jejuia sp.]
MKLKILIIAFLFPIALLNAQTFFTVDGFDYRTDVNSTVMIVGGDCSQSELNIPANVFYSGTNFTVTSIGDSAFAGCTALTQVNFPDTITFIREAAFLGCTSLETINIPSTVIGIFDRAFSGCTGLTSATLNNTSSILNRSTFENCSSLETVNIQPTVEIIEANVFKNCTSLTSITFPSALEILGSSAFENTGITSVDLPSVQSFGSQVFARTPITSIDFPASYIDVPSAIFSGCDQLATVNLPSSIQTIGDAAFGGCDALNSIDLPNNLIEIGDGAFGGTGLVNLVLPNSVISLGDGAFSTCRSLETITFSSALKTIGPRAFRRCDKLTTFVLPNTLEEIGVQAFEQCFDITEVVIPDSVTEIGSSAFNRCFDLVNVTLSNKLTALNSNVFNECRKLAAIEIPSSVTSIADFAFAKTALRDVTVNWQTPVTINANVFDDITLAFADLFVPQGTVATYETADVWMDFGNIIESVPVIINIPDTNFEQALVDKGIDSDGVVNGQVLESDIIDIETLDVSSRSISDLTGIEGFKNVETLFVQDNDLTTVDLSANTALSGLLIALNNLSSLDISTNVNLISLNANFNNLSTIDLSNNLGLEQIYVNNNELTSIDVSMLSNLKELDVAANNLVELNLENNGFLNILFCQDNNLANLNLQNGNNTNIADTNFNAALNENLFCIQVDDANFSTNTWNTIDAQSFFGLDCAPSNDGCADATPLTLGSIFNGTNISATSSNATPGCQQGDLVILDVWFEFDAPDSASVFIGASSLEGIVKFAIYEDCNSVTPIACSANDLLLDNLTIGQKYYIQVWIEADTSDDKSSRTKTSAFTNQQPGNFTLNVQDASVLSTSEVELSKIKLYPNPASNEVTIASTSQIENISIYNVLGEQVYFENNANSTTSKININHLSKGLYIVSVKTLHHMQTKRLIIK